MNNEVRVTAMKPEGFTSAREEREEIQQGKVPLQEDDTVYGRQTGHKTYPGSMDTRE